MEFGIKCPYCEYEHDGLDYFEPNDMEADFLMDCEDCKRQFSVTVKTSIQFKIEKSE